MIQGPMDAVALIHAFGVSRRAARDRRPRSAPEPRSLAASIPGSELEVVRGANHLWNLQQPEAFNQILAAFVDRAVPAQT